MRRLITALLTAALLAVPFTVPVAAGNQDRCTKGNVQSIANGTIAIAKQFDPAAGKKGAAGAWACQFRLYDDNDDFTDPFFGPNVDNPEVPHVFTDKDWFLAGIFDWVTKDDMETYDLSRQDAVAFLNSRIDRFFWREKGVSGWSTQLPLKQTTHRAVNSPFFGKLPVMFHRHHIFSPGSVDPGTYEWKWEVVHPVLGPFTAFGEVRVEDA